MMCAEESEAAGAFLLRADLKTLVVRDQDYCKVNHIVTQLPASSRCYCSVT
jgi:hypothetical protein